MYLFVLLDTCSNTTAILIIGEGLCCDDHIAAFAHHSVLECAWVWHRPKQPERIAMYYWRITTVFIKIDPAPIANWVIREGRHAFETSSVPTPSRFSAYVTETRRRLRHQETFCLGRGFPLNRAGDTDVATRGAQAFKTLPFMAVIISPISDALHHLIAHSCPTCGAADAAIADNHFCLSGPPLDGGEGDLLDLSIGDYLPTIISVCLPRRWMAAKDVGLFRR